MRTSYQALSEEDKSQIRLAFEVAVDAHQDQRRKSGEAYIFHPIAVAQIVAQEIGLPPGVLNIIHGTGPAAGDAIVKHPSIKAISFTGGTQTGAYISRTAGPMFKKLSLELGGKNPIIIFPDADPKKAANFAVKGMNMNRQGQSCSSTSRVLVHQDLHHEVLKEMKRLAEDLPVGLPWLEKNELGPIVSEIQYKKILNYTNMIKMVM